MTYAAEVATDTPVLAWPLDETSGTAAADVSGNARDGTYFGSPVLAGGTAYSLVGPEFANGDYVEADSNLVVSAPFTLEIVVDRDAFLTGQTGDINSLCGDLIGTNNGVLLRWDGNTDTITAYVPNGGSYTTISATVDTAPHHVVLECDTAGIELWVDGSSVASTSSTPSGFNMKPRVSRSEDGRYSDMTAVWFAVYDALLGATRIGVHAAAAAEVIPALHIGLTIAVSVTATGSGVSETQRVRLAPGVSGPIGAPVRVRLASEDASTGLAVKVFRPPDYRHAVDVITKAKFRGGQVRLNQPGEGHMTIGNRHPDRDLIESDDLIMFELEGEPVWSWIVGPSTSATIRPSEGDQSTTFSGPGLLSLTAKAPVLPSNGLDAQPVEEDRLFSWPSPQYRDATWRNATELGSVASSVGVWPLAFGGEGDHAFPDPGSSILGPSSGTMDTAPVGLCYFRGTVTIATTDRYIVYVAADNTVDFYIDGQKLAVSDDLRLTTAIRVTLTAGEHTFAAVVFNGAQLPPAGPTDHNPLGLAVAWWTADAAGEALVFTGRADNSWKILEYPPVAPGMTPGEAILLWLEEAQALNMMTGWVCSFTKDEDSNGVPWPIAPDLATKVGYSGETFIVDELAATYIDVRASIGGLVLHAYNKDTLGVERTLTFHAPTDPQIPASGNLPELTHDRTPRVANAMLVRWQGGWHPVDATEPGDITTMVPLGLGSAQSVTEVERIANGQLDRYAHQRDAVTAKFRPATVAELPHRAAWVGDTVDVPNWDGTTSLQRILAWTFDEDEHGLIAWSPEIADVIYTADERAMQAIAKMANGTVSGDSTPAQPISSISTPGASCCIPIAPPPCD